MPYNPKKLAVLSVLKKLERKATQIQLPALMLALGDSFSARSVRRWLQELIQEGLVVKYGQKRGSYYNTVVLHQEMTSPSSKENLFSFSKPVCIALEKIKKPVSQRHPVIYNKTWVDTYQPNHVFYLTSPQRHALKAVGQPEVAAMPAGTYARKIYDRLLVELSYNSSRLEGNTYSLGETEKLILEGADSTGKLDAEKIMILNHKEAIRYLVDHAGISAIHANTICTLNYLLSDGLVLPSEAGKVRNHSVKIGRSTYMPMDDQSRLSEQLNHICAMAEKIHDPHEQSFFLLVHIAYLQAFTDVNKRTARLSANIPFIKNNLYPISFSKVDKDDYISAMIAIYELNDVRALAELYTFSCLYTAREYNLLIASIGFNEARIRFRKELRNLMHDVIVKKLVGQSMENYIEKTILSIIPTTFQTDCIQAIKEDLAQMGPERIAGLGVTQQELSDWLVVLEARKRRE